MKISQENQLKPEISALQVNLEHLNGSIERVTFHSEESGFCVLRVKVVGHSDLITITGSAASVSPGEYIDCEGQFINDRQYGLQFKTTKMAIVPPGTIEGIEKYLASGMIKGIGPHFAKKLVKAFGENVFTVIEENPKQLLSLPGIGHSRMQAVMSGWAEQKAVRDIMVFLQSYGVGTSRAVRIYKTYGNDAIAKVNENPYRLALDIHGIGFKTADTIAQKLGIPANSAIRAQAGIRHTLQELAAQGHCAYAYDDLIEKTSELLTIEKSIIQAAIVDELNTGNIVAFELDEKQGHKKDAKQLIYLKALYQAEEEIAKQLMLLNKDKNSWSEIDLKESLTLLKKENIELSPSQIEALELALSNKVLVITGGPGVGKTTLVKSIVKILCAKGATVSLCAPTGRAAKRLSESTGLAAKTIHRLLEFDPKYGGFKHNQDNQLTTDIIIIDETSMIDVSLMSKLLQAIPANASLFLIGDVDQLPSVGPGTVLSDIIDSDIVKTARLTEIFRQAASSKIVVNAHRINKGQTPDFDLPKSESNASQDELSDFYFIAAETPEEITNKLIKVVCERIPKRFGFHPTNDIQVLTPMNRSGLGARALNVELQKQLNNYNVAQTNSITKFGSSYASGDKVIQVINNYDKEVFNGDIGTIFSIDKEEGKLQIDFDGRKVEYEFSELDELALAYAVSIHKSQGSEYKAVVIPISTSHYVMLERNLLYTAVTRGKELVVLIGQKKALAMAIKNKCSVHRVTALKQRLQGTVSK